ncbi:MAG: ABC-F family ATP-binding cassette domain-containing protein, partial [Bdellovibrionota bacterium]
ATETPTEAELERYGRILEEWEDMDESRLEARAKEILTGMGFKLTDFGRALTEFSGGWLMRVALSRILLLEPDLLLLDEPTNHLDLESLLWLEEFLQNYRGAMLLVSHDSAFLNRMVTEVVEIDQKRLWTYRGNLDSYAEQKEERLKVLRAQYAGQQAKIAEIEAFVARFGAKATKARQAQSRLKQLDKMERIELDESRETVRFRFPPAPHSGREVVTVRGADFAYEPGKPVLRKMDWVIQRGSRVAIVGVNGAGKTTLLKLLSGSMAPTTGFLKHGHEVKLGYYAQHQAESLDMKKTILQELESTAPELPVSRIRGIAGAFLFSGDAVEKRCGVLSGGEKARVALAKLLLSPSNFLILDEPTNHLDVESRGVLLEGLQDYEGTMVLVSHDREFMGPLVDAVLEIRDGQVHQLVGDYESYLKMKTREIAQTVKPRQAKVATPETPATARTGPSNNQRKSWERERDKLEAEITKLERQQSELHAKLANQATYDDQEQLKKLLEDQRGIEHQMSEKLSRWETLCSLLG